MRAMAKCSKCGKRIGLLEYVSADNAHKGLCRECREEKKLCSSCIHYLKLSGVLDKSTVARCLKYGYDLSNHKNHATAANCPFFSTTMSPKKTAKTTEEKPRNSLKKKTTVNNKTEMSLTPEDFWNRFEEWKKNPKKDSDQ